MKNKLAELSVITNMKQIKPGILKMYLHIENQVARSSYCKGIA